MCQASSHSSDSRPSSPISSRTCAGRAGAAARHAATTVAIPGGAAGPPERFVGLGFKVEGLGLVGRTLGVKP